MVEMQNTMVGSGSLFHRVLGMALKLNLEITELNEQLDCCEVLSPAS